jgi:hypothetical protein
VNPAAFVRQYYKESFHQQLLAAIGRCLPHQGLALRTKSQRLCWVPRMLVTCGVGMCWASGRTLKDRFGKARDATVGMYPTRRRPGKSYAGFMATLVRRSAGLLGVIRPALRKRVRQVAGSSWRVEGRVVFGVDGSRMDCPMTAANEGAFGCAGKNKTGPQQLVTTLFHAGTGLIWDWRRGDGGGSERAHLREMLDGLPPGATLLADAGYTGYGMLQQLQAHRIDFLLRVGSNVELLTDLGHAESQGEGIVHLWPLREQKKGCPPLVLRLIVLRDERNRNVYLLSNVLDKRQLSDAAAGRLYRLRWGVELLYRALKQTLEHRKLLSDSPRPAEVELDWTMVGLWMLGLMSLEAMQRASHPPHAWSVAGSLRVVRQAMDKGVKSHRQGGLRDSLAACVKDKYPRSSNKKARNAKNKKTEQPPGAPNVRMAEESEVLLAQQLRETKYAA